MNLREIITRSRKLSKPFLVTDGKHFRLKDVDPADTGSLKREDKPLAQEMLVAGIAALRELQERLYAQDCWVLLLVFQAIDGAGKDSVIKHVMSGVNPQGCQIYSFKRPSDEELDHDYLWRCVKVLPERGRIGIFNRSYYEEIVVVRVHPDLLANQKLPRRLVTKHIWEERAGDIRHFERYLTRNGVAIRKFFLRLSKQEQKRRFLERLEKPEKHWKFSLADIREREFWSEYMDAYEEMIRNTATEDAPWYVVPADHKWFTRIVVAAAVIDALGSLNLTYPKLNAAKKRELALGRKALVGNGALSQR